MKMQPDRIAGVNVIGGYNAQSVEVLGQREWRESVLLPWQGAPEAWNAARFDDLSAAHFERVAALGPELVLFGSGERLRFAKAEWLRPLIARGIGCESMDTKAACRTYNLLVGEGRSVVAALLLGSA
jgi:uncharacterized protein